MEQQRFKGKWQLLAKQISAILWVVFSWGLTLLPSQAQDVMMQGWYWDYPKTAGGHKWADTLRLKSPELGRAGINYLWIPPHVRASFGNNSNGYDPQDYYDLGEFGRGPTGLGTRAEYDAMMQAFQQNNINAVGDMVYNHRDGGRPEANPALKTYMEGFNNASNNPFPTDRYHLALPIGGSTGNGAGTYFITFASRTGNARFVGTQVKLYAATNRRNAFSGNTQNVPNGQGGADCGQPTFTAALVTDVFFNLATCGTELRFDIGANDFNAAGDTLFLYLRNPNNNYTDHWVKKLWRVNSSGTPANADIKAQVIYQTFTDYSQLPSRRGGMRWYNFKPNGKPTNLGGDWDSYLFFYDYDQSLINDNQVTIQVLNSSNQLVNTNPGKNTQDTLFEWTKWSWQQTNIRGIRVDAIKHFDPQFMSGLLNFLHQNNINPGMVVGEMLDTDFNLLSNWVNQVKNGMTVSARNAIKPKVFDFSLRENLRQACDDGNFNVRNVYAGTLGSSGFNGILPENVVSFTNNHDFRENTGFNSVIRNNNRAILAYAYIFTNARAGVPLIFYPDYYGYPPPAAAPSTLWSYHPTGLNPMRTRIDQLIQIYRQYTWQSAWVDYLNANTGATFINYVEGSANRSLIYQLAGNGANKRVLVAINFGSSRLRADIQMRGAMTNGQKMVDVLGVSNTQTLTLENKNISGSKDNMVYIDIPANSYAIWVEGDNVMGPSALRATAVSTTAIRLNWVDNAGNESGYRVERSPNGTSGWTEIASNLPAGTSTYLDENLTTNTQYFYRVRAFLNIPALQSIYTNVANATTINLPAPSNLTAVANTANTGVIDVNWNDNSPNETGFVLERSPNGTSGWQNINLAPNVTNYSDGGLSAGTYFYRIRARLLNAAQGIDAFSDYSNTANATINDQTTALEDSEISRQVKLYPNPAQEVVNVRFEANLATHTDSNIIYLFDLQGNNVTKHIKNTHSNIEDKDIIYRVGVQNLPKGTYFLMIDTNKGRALKRFAID